MIENNATARTAGAAGWHISRYGISAQIPGTEDVAFVNLIRGSLARLSPPEQYLLSILETLPESHPAIGHFAERGIIASYDEYAALESMGRGFLAFPKRVTLTVCPTLSCNFDCPYCYETHTAGKMTPEVQEDVVHLAERLLSASRAPVLDIVWFGGEPLLCPDVIEQLSERFMSLADQFHAQYTATAITNGYLLTEKMAELLHRCRVSLLQITLDGIGAVHDATRPLAGGGPTFDRIIAGLSRPLPFRVNIRHNVHRGNLDEVEPLRAFVAELREKTGNRLSYCPALVTGNETADCRGRQVSLLSGPDACRVGLLSDAHLLCTGKGSFCSACSLWAVAVEPSGRLVKCWENVDKPSCSFGAAAKWDPLRPLETADRPDALTEYLNAAVPFADEECSSCVWLPKCAGGCPNARLKRNKRCVPWKDDPEAYIRAVIEAARAAKPDASLPQEFPSSDC